jgi:peptide/nickel transport system permease protein
VAAVEEETREAEPEAVRGKVGLGTWVCLSWLVLVIVLAAIAGFLPLPDPKRTGLGPVSQGFTGAHPFGLDDLGRDMLSRVIFGARVSLIVGFSSIALGLLVGGALGVVAGYYRGRIEGLIMWAMDVLLAFPALVFALAIVTFMGQSLRNVTIAIAVIAVPPIARLVRSTTLNYAQREFVLAARSLGAKNRRIIAREILPNVVVPAFSFGLIGVALAIVGEGALAFLGLSVRLPTPTWGGMIDEGRTVLQQAPHVSLVPCGVMFVTILALNYLGDTLRAHFDVREGAL